MTRVLDLLLRYETVVAKTPSSTHHCLLPTNIALCNICVSMGAKSIVKLHVNIFGEGKRGEIGGHGLKSVNTDE